MLNTSFDFLSRITLRMVSQNMGTHELTGLVIMATSAFGHDFETAVAIFFTKVALVLNKSSLVIPEKKIVTQLHKEKEKKTNKCVLT